MTSRDTTRHNAGDPGSIESWLVSAGRDRRPGSPLNVPPVPASNFVLGERRAYARDDGTPGWEALEEIVGGLEGGASVAFASGMAGIAAVFDQLRTGSVVALPDEQPGRDRAVDASAHPDNDALLAHAGSDRLLISPGIVPGGG